MPIWQNGADDEDGIVISSRARLARNIRDKPFATKISDVERDAVIEQVLAAAKSSSQMENSTFFWGFFLNFIILVSANGSI